METKVKLEKLKVQNIYEALKTVTFTSSAAAILFFFTIVELLNIEIPVVWVLTVILINFCRLYLGFYYKKDTFRHGPYLWLKFYSYSTLLSGLAWGSISLFLIDKVPLQMTGVVIAYILAMTMGGAVSNIAYRRVAISYTLTILLPFYIKVMIEDNPYKSFFLSGFTLFIFLVVRMILILNKQYDRNFKLVLEKEGLLEELKEKFRVEQELKEEKIKTLNSSKLAAIGQMASGIAHEIKNPLTISSGGLKLLRAKIDNTDEVSLIDKVINANSRIVEIVNSIRNLTYLKRSDELGTISVASIVNTAMPLCTHYIKRFEVEIISDYQDEIILGHIGELSQVLVNLISNAIHAVSKLDEKWVKISTEVQNEYISIKVTDSGHGIEEEILSKMFDPFFTSKKVGEGTGLGLSLSKSLMLSNRGDLEYLENCKNTTFVMKISRAKSSVV